MSDNLDDDLSLDESFDDFEKKERSLGDMWRESAGFKIGVIIAGVILFFLVLSFFSSDEAPIDESYMGAAPDITATPGTEEASPAYVQAIEELNEADIERAMKEGDSSLPVPIEPPVGIVSLPEQGEVEEDPLQRWRRLQEERLEREIQQQSVAIPDTSEADAQRAEAVQALADAMSAQMSSILETQATPMLSTKNLTDPNFLEALKESQEEGEEGEGEFIEGEDEFGEDVTGEILLPAGEIAFAQLLIEANTDTPGPVLAQILSGPLKGSRILGTFEEQDDLLTLNFDTVVYEGESLSIDAIALDPDTSLPGMATEVDHRYFKRIVLPAATAFVQGMADAIAESGRTTVTIQGETVAETEDEASDEQEVATGVQEAGQKLGEILDEIAADTEVLVRIKAGTPLGILFLEPVTTDEQEDFAVAVPEDLDPEDDI